MMTYRVKVNTNGEILLPKELRDLLGLVAGDTLELNIDAEGKFFIQTAERSVGPLSDFFEDLILSDLHCQGCSGDALKAKLLERKLQLSTVLDRLAEESHRLYRRTQALKWREAPELKFLELNKKFTGEYNVLLTTRSERELRKLPEEILGEIPKVFESLEQDPMIYKRLRGPYYETYRVSFQSDHFEHYRVLYTIFEEDNLVIILNLGERKSIYEHIKGLAH